MLSTQQEFLAAIRNTDLTKIQQLLETNPSLASTKTSTGVSATIFALYNGNKQVAATIAEKKGKLDIFEAASLGELAQLIDLVRNNSSLVNSYSPDGFTPVALAAYLGQKETVEYLVENGADVNAVAKNETGFTPLTGAVSQNHTEVAKILVKSSANVNHSYEGGFTPLAHAASSGNIELVRLLLDYGADPNTRTPDGKSPLRFALEKNHPQVVTLLREHGAR
jgi:uncharacterized protein